MRGKGRGERGKLEVRSWKSTGEGFGAFGAVGDAREEGAAGHKADGEEAGDGDPEAGPLTTKPIRRGMV